MQLLRHAVQSSLWERSRSSAASRIVQLHWSQNRSDRSSAYMHQVIAIFELGGLHPFARKSNLSSFVSPSCAPCKLRKLFWNISIWKTLCSRISDVLPYILSLAELLPGVHSPNARQLSFLSLRSSSPYPTPSLFLLKVSVQWHGKQMWTSKSGVTEKKVHGFR